MPFFYLNTNSRHMEKIKSLLSKFKALTLEPEFIFGFPFVLFVTLAFALKSVWALLVLVIWLYVIVNNNHAKTPDEV